MTPSLPISRGHRAGARAARPGASADEPVFVRQQVLEAALLRVRWATVPLCLLLVPLFPSVTAALVIGLAMVLGLGNAALAWLLRAETSPPEHRLRLVGWLATGLEWGIALGVLLAFAGDPPSNAPALLPLLVLITTARFGLPGLLGSVLAAALAICGLEAAQVYALEVVTASAARPVVIGWLLLIAATALVTHGLLQAASAYLQWEAAHWERWHAALRRLESGLTEREWTLLQLLAKEEMTYEQIAARLHICPATVKTHVQHIGRKLGATGRRHIVAAARERGLLAPTQPPLTDT